MGGTPSPASKTGSSVRCAQKRHEHSWVLAREGIRLLQCVIMSSATLARLERIYHQPLFDLIQQARAVYLEHWKDNEVQLCTLLSIKTGGCPEDCSYCAQSARYPDSVKPEKLMGTAEVVELAQRAKTGGATRFCMGAAWRGAREGTAQFESVLEIVRSVSGLGMEVCVTLGELTESAARQLRHAGAHTYNHNIDTSPEFYPNIVTTHTLRDRLDTIRAVQKSGMTLCSGGIIGMGESVTDRLRMLEVLLGFNPPPESVPINCLMPMPGTPLEDRSPVEVFEWVRLIATARIAFPRAKVRLSAGRTTFSKEAQALCFFAGANSIFFGDKLLTATNPAKDEDLELLSELGLQPMRLAPKIAATPLPQPQETAGRNAPAPTR
jgi:biotin synthase